MSTKRLFLSLGMFVFVVAVAIGGTGAFFSDTETSTGNVFTAGDIDLLVGNESYVTDVNGDLVASAATSWAPGNLTGQLFFNFADLKPGDIGEDTITLQVNTNDAWACFTPTITGTPENGQSEPEAAEDATAGLQDGELQDELVFVVWSDDGDNVFEDDERLLQLGGSGDPTVTAQEMADLGTVTLADSTYSIFTSNNSPAPMTGTQEYHIGKAWCYGEMTEDPVAQDGLDTSGPLVRGTGLICDGSTVSNVSQTDGIEVSLQFATEQSRNNGDFTCVPPVTVTTGASWSPEALAAGGWTAKGRFGDNNPTAGAYEMEVGFGPGDRDEDNHGWTSGVGETFTLVYNSGTEVATLTIGSDVSTYTLTGAGIPTSIGITAKGADIGVTSLTGATLDGNPIADTTSTNGVYEHTSVTGPEVMDGDFTLTGTLTLTWTGATSNEKPALQIDVD